MEIKCPKCKNTIYVDASMLYDEFTYNSESCDVCCADIVYNYNGIVLFTSVHEPISVTVDVILRDSAQRILFVKRKFPPDLGKYALPGGFVGSFETSQAAAIREVREETGLIINECGLQLCCVMSNPGRDSRGRVISIVYVYDEVINENPVAGDDAAAVEFFDIHNGSIHKSNIAFDHAQILYNAVAAEMI